MEDDKLKEIFSNFEPGLSSDLSFMARLQHNLDAVEIIKRHNAAQRAQNRRAVAIAAIVGFVVGVLFSLSLPYLCAIMASITASLPSESVLKTIANHYSVLGCFIIGATSVLMAKNTYDISLALQQKMFK